MTPEEAQALQAHVDAIAAILYQNTDPEKLSLSRRNRTSGTPTHA